MQGFCLLSLYLENSTHLPMKVKLMSYIPLMDKAINRSKNVFVFNESSVFLIKTFRHIIIKSYFGINGCYQSVSSA